MKRYDEYNYIYRYQLNSFDYSFRVVFRGESSRENQRSNTPTYISPISISGNDDREYATTNVSLLVRTYLYAYSRESCNAKINTPPLNYVSLLLLSLSLWASLSSISHHHHRHHHYRSYRYRHIWSSLSSSLFMSLLRS